MTTASLQPHRPKQPLAALRRVPPLGLVSAVLLLVLVAAIVSAPAWVPYDPNQQDLLNRLQSPSLEHWLGTDHLGRDVFARIIYGGRFSLTIVTVTLLLSAVIGTGLGMVSGWVGGWVDEVLMRLVDVIIAFPELMIALIITALVEPGFFTLVLAVTISSWTTFARLARAVTLEILTQDYITAGIGLGAPSHHILRKHIFPNLLAPLLSLGYLRFGHLLLIITGLSYLGLGAQPPTSDWGTMLAEAQPYMQRVPTLILAPGLTILFTTFCVNYAGQALSFIYDPFANR